MINCRNIPQETVRRGENTPRHNFQTQKKRCVRFVYVCTSIAAFFLRLHLTFFLRFQAKMAPAKKTVKKRCERLQIVLSMYVCMYVCMYV